MKSLVFTLPPPVLVVELALPAKGLSPNASKGSSRKSKSGTVKLHRDKSGWAFKVAMRNASVGKLESVSIRAVFYFNKNARRDAGNAMASLKPAVDGMVDAGLLRDDSYRRLTELPPLFLVDKARPRVELRVYDRMVEFKESEE